MFVAVLLLFAVAACSSSPKRFVASEAGGQSDQVHQALDSMEGVEAINYERIFAAARKIMERPGYRKVIVGGVPKRLDTFSETQLVEWLQANPHELLKIENESISAENLSPGTWDSVGQYDPTKPLRMRPPKDPRDPIKFLPGYSNLKIFASHPYYKTNEGIESNLEQNLRSELVPSSNLRQEWIRFVLQAEKEIMINVFDFDLRPVAEALSDLANGRVARLSKELVADLISGKSVKLPSGEIVRLFLTEAEEIKYSQMRDRQRVLTEKVNQKLRLSRTEKKELNRIAKALEDKAVIQYGRIKTDFNKGQFIETQKSKLVLLPNGTVASILKNADGMNLPKVSVRVGIDANVILARKEVATVKNFLEQNGVTVVPVNSVGLNHQKMTILDWSDRLKAKVLLSSGNLTQSCIGPEGDLANGPASVYSLPNANHFMTMDSWLLANLIKHEFSKTFDSKLRGAEYPMTTAYQITGEGVDFQTLEPYPKNSLVIAFSPRGGMNAINKSLISYVIRKTSGPIYMMQFAYSSKEVDLALRERAVREIQQSPDRKFEFYSVGDTPFAMQDWSQFLSMSAYKLVHTPIPGDSKNEIKEYIEDTNSPWLAELGSDHMTKLRQTVLIAPPEYGNHKVRDGAMLHEVSAKIHHKMLISGDSAIMGTSFNFSSGAETNNEQIVVWHDPQVVNAGKGMVRYMRDQSLLKNSAPSVVGEAQRRGRRKVKIKEEVTSTEDAALNKVGENITPQPPIPVQQ